MSRDLSVVVSENIEDDVLYPFFATELNFDDDNDLRLWTGFGTLHYGGVDYFGTGNLLDVSAVEETTQIAARGATLTLAGVPSEVISLALSQPYQGRTCKMYFGLFQRSPFSLQTSQANVDTYILKQDGGKILLETQLTSLTEIFTGYMDQMSIEEHPDYATIELKVENKLIDLERRRVARYTSEYQRTKYPNDKGFDFVESLQDLKLNWGRENA